jgi:Cdc6-like AAA superfamily ATPase
MQTVTDSKPGAVVFDRRQVYRPFLERLNPIASSQSLLAEGLIVAPDHDPRDAGQPPIHVAFASVAELSRGSQMALVGGIGSGKTTELLLTQKVLSRHSDAINVYVDLADYTDLSEISTGAILAAAGMQLYSLLRSRLKNAGKELPEAVKAAHAKLRELALGKTNWVKQPPEPYDYEPDGDELYEVVQVKVPGVMKLRFPALRRQVFEILEQLFTIASTPLETDVSVLRSDDRQITLLIDGLDRLIRPHLFREFAEQDLQALKGTKISVIIVAPLLLWYDKSRFLQDYFDPVKHIPAAAADPQHSDFLRKILQRRGAPDLMDRAEITSIAKYSGGVLRDLLTLARSSAEYAYRDGEDRISRRHVNAAIKQIGNRYLAGLGNTQKRLLRSLIEDGEFPIENSTARELLVSRQVLEYFKGGVDYFAVHPALAKVLPKPA